MQNPADRYCVFGNPIAHSKSPQIHSAFAKQSEQNLSYDKQLVELTGFESAAREFFFLGGKGLNITVPFKEDAFKFADELSERAKAAGAVNTLAVQENGRIFGDNTDGAGLVWDIQERLKWDIGGKRVLILGAGGAVKGVLLPLIEQNPASITIVNRTVSKAESLAEKFNNKVEIYATSFEALGKHSEFDLIINATSASLSGTVPTIPESSYNTQTAVYDMVYGDEDTAFIVAMRRAGLTRYSDGLGMLLGQAAESFYLWRGLRPDVQSLIDDFRVGS